jgi:hypothetical protein
MKRPVALAGLVLAIGLAAASGVPAGGWAVAGSGVGVARADGDPASDVLPGQDVFVPYSSISPALERRLYAVAAAVRRAGYPLKIALIGARTDLGVVPALFGRPAAYARFLSTELSGVVNGPVLVVMPGGFGLAASGRPLSTAALAGVAIGPGADGLALAALAASARIAARAGHPLPPGAIIGPSPLGASPGTVRHALLALAVMGALTLAGVGGALAVRSR